MENPKLSELSSEASKILSSSYFIGAYYTAKESAATAMGAEASAYFVLYVRNKVGERCETRILIQCKSVE